MRGRRRASRWTERLGEAAPEGVVVVAFVVAILSFFLGTFYSQTVVGGIEAEARVIATNAVPSVIALESARTEVRRALRVLGDHVERAGTVRNRPTRGDAAQRVESLSAAVHRYEELPGYPAERALRPELSRALVEVESASTRVLAVTELDLEAAVTRLDQELVPAVNRLDELLVQLAEINSAEVRRNAMEIERLAEQAALASLALDIASVLIALSIAAIALRFFRTRTDRLTSRSAELEQFASRVAHDVLSPLATASLSLETIQRHALGDPAVERSVLRGRSSIARVRQIAEGLLDFARAGARPEPAASTSLRGAVDGALEDVCERAASAGIELDVAAFPDVAVRVSPGVAVSLVSNLLGNAVKYMGDSAVRRVELRVVDRGQSVRVEVEDTGPGVPPESIQSLFEPYVRLSGSGQPGIGLGLATVKRVSEAHGGAAGARSALGKGSIFWFELPKA